MLCPPSTLVASWLVQLFLQGSSCHVTSTQTDKQTTLHQDVMRRNLPRLSVSNPGLVGKYLFLTGGWGFLQSSTANSYGNNTLLQLFSEWTHRHNTCRMCPVTLWTQNTQDTWNDATGFACCLPMHKLTHATPAWWQFTNAFDRNRLEAFLHRMNKSGYYQPQQSPTFVSLCELADKRLFFKICHNSTHPLEHHPIRIVGWDDA